MEQIRFILGNETEDNEIVFDFDSKEEEEQQNDDLNSDIEMNNHSGDAIQGEAVQISEHLYRSLAPPEATYRSKEEAMTAIQLLSEQIGVDFVRQAGGKSKKKRAQNTL